MKVSPDYQDPTRLRTLQFLSDNYGYWSYEVADYNYQLNHDEMVKLNSKVKRNK